MNTATSVLIICLAIGNVCNSISNFFLIRRVATLEFLVRHLMEEKP